MGLPSLLAKLPDQSAMFLAEGYRFQERLRRARGLSTGSEEPLRATLLGKPALIVRGRDGVRLFYDTSRMKRHGAMPLPVRGPLFGEGAVHGLDDEEHLVRKATFVKVAYEDAQVQRLLPYLEEEMRRTLDRLATKPGTVYAESTLTYGRAVLRWAGVPEEDAELELWSQRLAQIVDGFGKIGPAHVQAWVNRRRCDAWAADLIERTRAGELDPEPGTALAEWASFRNLDGSVLDAHTAGVELQNSTRPAIAVARFAAFAAAALVQHPEHRGQIAAEVAQRGSLVKNPHAEAFAEEVRRLSPFVPMLPAFARSSFEWAGQQIKAGQRILIDVLGTNNDPAEWEAADRFEPARFLGVDRESLPAFIPQGGGDVRTGHRCPGEKIAVACLATTVSGLCTPGVELSDRGLDVDWTTLPTMPRSGVWARVVR